MVLSQVSQVVLSQKSGTKSGVAGGTKSETLPTRHTADNLILMLIELLDSERLTETSQMGVDF